MTNADSGYDVFMVAALLFWGPILMLLFWSILTGLFRGDRRD